MLECGFVLVPFVQHVRDIAWRTDGCYSQTCMHTIYTQHTYAHTQHNIIMLGVRACACAPKKDGVCATQSRRGSTHIILLVVCVCVCVCSNAACAANKQNHTQCATTRRRPSRLSVHVRARAARPFLLPGARSRRSVLVVFAWTCARARRVHCAFSASLADNSAHTQHTQTTGASSRARARTRHVSGAVYKYCIKKNGRPVFVSIIARARIMYNMCIMYTR